MNDLTRSLELDLAEPPRVADNAAPHPVILSVHPRLWQVPFAHEFEAEYDVDVEHPSTCSGSEDECPLADYIACVGFDDLLAGFPEPDHLTDHDLAVLHGTVRYVTVTRCYSRWSNHDGEGWDVDYNFAWSD